MKSDKQEVWPKGEFPRGAIALFSARSPTLPHIRLSAVLSEKMNQLADFENRKSQFTDFKSKFECRKSKLENVEAKIEKRVSRIPNPKCPNDPMAR